MARFDLRTVAIMDADGTERTYAVIADRAAFETVAAPFGPVPVGAGFIRCRGRRYIGTYGRETPALAGGDDDTYFSPVSYYDGTWRHTGADDRGLYHYVTAGSGTGRLFGDLLAFCEVNNVPAADGE